MSKRPSRSSAEWVTFGASVVVLLGIVALILVEATATDAPARPVARRAGSVRIVEGRYFVPVEVRNHGDKTATEVEVVARMKTAGSEVQGTQVIQFLAGDERQRLEFVFDEDPATGNLEVGVTGYQDP